MELESIYEKLSLISYILFGESIREVACMNIRIKLLFILILLLPTTAIYALEAQQTGDLTIVLTGFENNNGLVWISLVNSEQGYVDEHKAYCGIRTKLTNRRVEIVLKGIPYGEYGIRTYHDEDESGELSKNFLGIPKDAYGFSNNVRGLLGTPPYDKVSFQLNVPAVTVNITVKKYP